MSLNTLSNMFVQIYLVVIYLFGLIVMTMKYQKEGELEVGDLLLLISSPFSMVSVLLIRLVSPFVDIDQVILRK